MWRPRKLLWIAAGLLIYWVSYAQGMAHSRSQRWLLPGLRTESTGRRALFHGKGAAMGVSVEACADPSMIGKGLGGVVFD